MAESRVLKRANPRLATIYEAPAKPNGPIGSRALARKMLGLHIVCDPVVRQDQPTFDGTQVLVTDILEQVAKEMDWDSIIRQFDGRVSRPAIAEAVRLAARALTRYDRRPSRGMRRRVEYGRHVVADPAICHGKVTFNGTRVFVDSALEMVAEEVDWSRIIWEWHESITRESIAEAVKIGGQALVRYARRLPRERWPA